MEIRPAEISDLPAIMQIVEDARTLIQSKHFHQWDKASDYPSKTDFVNDIENKALYVAVKDNTVAAMMAIYDKEDENYDEINGCWLSTSAYRTIHRLAVKHTFYGQGLAKALIQEAIRTAKGKVLSIRIDTHPKNKPMNTLAQKLGFQYCGVIRIKKEKTEPERNAYERMIE